MTNLICAVIVTLATNWTTVSRTVPEFIVNTARGPVGSQMSNQVGTRVTNYVALVAWKGRTNEVVLESVPDSSGQRLERSIPDPNSGIILTPALNCTQDYLYSPTLHWETNIFLDAN